MSKKVNNNVADINVVANNDKEENVMSENKMYAVKFENGEVFGVQGANRAALEAMLKQAGYTNASIVEAKPVTKKIADNFAYIDDAKTVASCSHCGGEVTIGEIPADQLDECKKLGLCPSCLAQYQAFKAWEADHKAVTAKKQVVNGGKKVGERLRAAFNDAIASPNFKPEMLLPWFETGLASVSHQVFKFSTYPLIWNVTGMSPDEQKNYSEIINGKTIAYRNRFYARVYQVGDCQFKLCSQIYDAQLPHAVAEFKRLGLLAEDAEY